MESKVHIQVDIFASGKESARLLCDGAAMVLAPRDRAGQGFRVVNDCQQVPTGCMIW
jgi:hypothetical protein